jgi:hypothetical protein
MDRFRIPLDIISDFERVFLSHHLIFRDDLDLAPDRPGTAQLILGQATVPRDSTLAPRGKKNSIYARHKPHLAHERPSTILM